jgi:4-aminobutyrate aminotransferase-like enzyme
VRINPPLIISEETALNGLAILDEALGTIVRAHRLE